MPVSLSNEQIERLQAKAARLSDRQQAAFSALKRYSSDPGFLAAVLKWHELEVEYQRAAYKAQLAEAGLLEE